MNECYEIDTHITDDTLECLTNQIRDKHCTHLEEINLSRIFIDYVYIQ